MTRPHVLAAALAGAALLAACHPAPEEPAGSAEEVRAEALAPRPVRLVRPEVREERPVIELVGEVRPDELIPVPAEVAGRLDRVLVEVGDRVAAGEPLAEIDRGTYAARLARAEADLDAARAELDLARRELARKEELRSDRTISEAVYDRARSRRDLAAARVRAAEAAVELERRELERSLVRAPAAGVVDRRRTAPGAWADVGQPVVDLATVGRLKVACRVPESWAENLAGIERLGFRTADGREREARILSVQPVAEGSSRSFEVVGTFRPDPAAPVRPGTVVTVRLEGGRPRSTLWLPATAVAAGEMARVMLVENGRAAARKVLTGRRADGMVEIVSGLAADEAVIADVAGLAAGVPVAVERPR